MSTTSTRPLQPPCAHMHPLHTRPNFSRAAGHFGWRRVLLLALGPSTPLLSASSRPARVVAPLQATSMRCTSCSRSRVESANTTSSMASGRKWPIFPCIGSSVTFTSSVVCRPCVQRSHSAVHDFCRPVRSRLLHAHPPLVSARRARQKKKTRTPQKGKRELQHPGFPRGPPPQY